MQNRLLEIKSTESMGRGMFARQYIPVNTLIMIAKDSNFFTYSLLGDHPLFASIMNQTEHKIVQFAYFLAYLSYEERQPYEMNALKQYMSVLPTTYHNLVCWSDSQLDKLANKKLVNKIKEKKDTIIKAYIEILANLFERENRTVSSELSLESQNINKPTRGSRGNRQNKKIVVNENIPVKQSILGKVTLEDVIRFVAVIQSRNAYYINSDDTRSAVGALIPELQIFNHSESSKCRVTLVDKEYRVFSIDKIEKGEEIFLNYGNHQIEYFLEFYGMIPIPEIEKQNFSFSTEKCNERQFSVATSNEFDTKVFDERDQLALTYNDLYRKNEQFSKKQQSIGKDTVSHRIALLERN